MKKYALLEHSSGQVWWMGEALSPADAASKCEHQTGLDHVAIVPASMWSGEDWTYAVHELPDDFEVRGIDGTDANVIARVRACPVVNYVGMTR
jgi:hypothetical protein